MSSCESGPPKSLHGAFECAACQDCPPDNGLSRVLFRHLLVVGAIGGEVKDYSQGRELDDLLSFMRTSHQDLQQEDPTDMPRRPRNVDRNAYNYIPYVDLLGEGNFSKVLDTKKVAFVMFYDPACTKCKNAGMEFVEAAKEAASKKRGFYAVDCSTQPNLCDWQQITDYPQFKLYVEGRYAAEYTSHPSALPMRRFVEKAPIDSSYVKKQREEL